MVSCAAREWYEYEPLHKDQWNRLSWELDSSETKLITSARWIYHYLKGRGIADQYNTENLGMMGDFVMKCIDLTFDTDDNSQLIPTAMFCIVSLEGWSLPPTAVPRDSPA